MANGSLVTPTNPVHKNDDIFILTSGLGPTEPPVEAGALSPSNPLAIVKSTALQVKLNGVNCTVVRAFLVPGKIGIYEIDVKVPTGITQGLMIPLVLIVDGIESTPTYIRVVD